jgi:hypothetical protein
MAHRIRPILPHDRQCQQVCTVPTTIEAIMWADAFEIGVEDVRAGRGFRPVYETPPARRTGQRDWQWAIIAGPDVALIGADGRPTSEAIDIYIRHAHDLL